MSFTRILSEQHRTIAHLFDALAREQGREQRERLCSRVAEELIAHMALEGVFHSAAADILGEAPRDVHAAVRVKLRLLLATDADDPTFQERVRSARDSFEEHVREEEEGVFPRVEQHASPEQLEALAERLSKRPPVWIVVTDPAVLEADEALRTGPSVDMPGVASGGVAR